MDLSFVTCTEYYAGLFKSSPKVTAHLSAGNIGVSGPAAALVTENAFESWECEVCGNRNPPGLSPAAARICTLCGVPRSLVTVPVASTHAPLPSQDRDHLSSSLPSSVFPSAFFSSSPSSHPSTHSSSPLIPSTRQSSSIACPACTFLNHFSMHFCEMCNTPLPHPASSQTARDAPSTLSSTRSAPSTRPVSPGLTESEEDNGPTTHMIKLSFRKGGDKAFYAVLKRSLMGKAWEVGGLLLLSWQNQCIDLL